ncbi:hypothetical protein N9X33_02585 [Alphaproteobacteria bacterium]|nr:hypothetical protein [Alphaproteobacteria bacterium]MDA8625268.1 hypothetical protein [Alphaproteobacteria bacterium]MDA8666584.1 hypothetical protein [Alphaproteobacteria bacterium]MDB2432245.1 hypothetical protein [Alphaproteobacteria bacterium]MDB2487458.1 hypothetical protein [Alphaproteobacteria bacterium]
MVNLAAKYLRPALTLVCAGCLMGAPIGGMSAAAQNAMRAPLNIVPPAMQEAIGQLTGHAIGRNAKSDKLAPRVAARQSKRAVRAVAAAPGSETGIVQVGQLGALQDAPIGLESGYGSNLWRGARLAFISGQMARLPRYLSLAALRDAELTLHRSTTAAPVGTVDGGSWYAARLNRFLALGDTVSVVQLEALTGAVSADPYAARAIVLAHLGNGAGEAACAIAAPKRGTRGYADTLPFFMQLLVYCQLRAGEFEKAGLTLQLNEKSLGEDRFYRELAFLMAAQTKPIFGTADDVAAAKAVETEPPLVVPSALTPMQLALLQLAGYGITKALDQLPPYFMKSLAEDYAQPPTTQLGAALAAVRHGSMTAERFSQLSQLTDLTSFQAPAEAEADAASEIATAVLPPPDAVFLALRLLEVDAQPITDQPRALAGALAQAQARGLWRDMVLLLDDRLQNVTLSAAHAAHGLADNFPADAPLEPAAPLAPAADFAHPFSDAVRSALLPALQVLKTTQKTQTQTQTQIQIQVEAEEKTTAEALAFAPSALALRLVQFGDAPQTLGDLIASLPGDEIFGGTPDEIIEPINEPENLGTAENEPTDMHPPPIADWQAFDAQYAAAPAPLRAYLTRELAIYEGLGFTIPAAYLVAAQDGALDADALRIQKLADNKWVGDLLLALVDLYGEENSATLEDTELVALLGYLRAAELDAVAAALAEEILLDAAGRLSLVAPSSFIASPVAAFGDASSPNILAASGALSVQP